MQSGALPVESVTSSEQPGIAGAGAVAAPRDLSQNRHASPPRPDDSQASKGSEIGSKSPVRLLTNDPIDDRLATRLVWAFLLLGVAERVVRYALRFPLWEDECFLSANLLDRGYLDLMTGLNYGQVCPVLFLWVQKTAVLLFGFNEYSLRLFALLTGLASLWIFRRLAGRLIQGAPLVIAVAIFAVGYPGVRYSSEAKQYSTDLLFGLLYFDWALAWWQGGGQRKWLWSMAALTPLAIGMSYPSVFVAGGVSLFVAWNLRRNRERRDWTAWAVFNAVLVLSFAALFAISAQSQSEQTLEFMQKCWDAGFPPLREPLRLPLWLLRAHTSDMLAYPFGGHNGGSILTFICCAAGLVVLARRRQGALMLLALAPLALSLAAAALHRYPYGEMVKFQIYMAPIFCTLAGLGAAALCFGPRNPPWAAPLKITLAALVVVGAATIVRDFTIPTKSAMTMRARDFARWFWFTSEFNGETLCLKTDLGQAFSAKTYEWGLSAMYLCNQRIYSPRHARGAPPQLDRVSGERPLRCVEYRSVHQEPDYDQAARDAWLASMRARYDLVAEEIYPFILTDRKGRTVRELDYLWIYKFVPKGAELTHVSGAIRR